MREGQSGYRQRWKGGGKGRERGYDRKKNKWPSKQSRVGPTFRYSGGLGTNADTDGLSASNGR